MPSTKHFVFLLVITLMAELICETCGINVVQYQFKRYPWKKKQKQSERRIARTKTNCEGTEACRGKFGLELIKCARMCMSQECYTELYAHDELEEGEIDVRYNSFRGCILEKEREKERLERMNRG